MFPLVLRKSIGDSSLRSFSLGGPSATLQAQQASANLRERPSEDLSTPLVGDKGQGDTVIYKHYDDGGSDDQQIDRLAFATHLAGLCKPCAFYWEKRAARLPTAAIVIIAQKVRTQE